MTHCYFVGVMNRDIDSGAASMIRAVERDFYFLNLNLLLHPGFSVKWQVASGILFPERTDCRSLNGAK